MITFFATAKAFHGHSGVIQRNALQSWKQLAPDVEVILFGDDDGASEVCAELGLRHEPHVERHESGMKYLNYMFKRAQEIARHKYLCYSNCDIIFMSDFSRAFQKAIAWRESFLMVGQRWDTDVKEPLDFSSADWQGNLAKLARSSGIRQDPYFIDYFVFTKGLYDEVAPLVVGRSYWDWWLVWKALDCGASVLDCSAVAIAVHQNHGHGYHPMGKAGTNEDELALRNVEVGGGRTHLRYILDATHKISSSGKIRRAYPFLRKPYFERKMGYKVQKVINVTHPFRKVLGLRRSSFQGIKPPKVGGSV